MLWDLYTYTFPRDSDYFIERIKVLKLDDEIFAQDTQQWFFHGNVLVISGWRDTHLRLIWMRWLDFWYTLDFKWKIMPGLDSHVSWNKLISPGYSHRHITLLLCVSCNVCAEIYVTVLPVGECVLHYNKRLFIICKSSSVRKKYVCRFAQLFRHSKVLKSNGSHTIPATCSRLSDAVVDGVKAHVTLRIADANRVLVANRQPANQSKVATDPDCES